MRELAARKRLLVAESEMNRRTLQVHCAEVEAAITGVGRFVQKGRTFLPILGVVGLVAGMFVARKKNPAKGFVAKALAGWQLLQTLKPVWAGFTARSRPTAEAEAIPPTDGPS
jgi:hypothetical protein